MPGPSFNLPNRITLMRLLGSLALFIILAAMPRQATESRQAAAWMAFVVFILTAASDWLDGYLARKRGEVTVFGRIMDPFVDKVLVCGALVLLLELEPTSAYLEGWMVVVIVVREFFVSSIRGFMESRGESFAALWSGKIKMSLQCVAIGALLFQLHHSKGDEGVPIWLHVVSLVAVWAAVISTIQSGLVYLLRIMQALEGSSI